MKQHIHAGLVSALLLAAGSAQAANQINDIEINNPIGYAQRIAMPTGSADISAWIGNASGVDVDYYTFYAIEGDVLTFDIDGGYGDGDGKSVDTIMAVFNVSNGYRMEGSPSDDTKSLDPGSISTSDPRIENFRVPTSGYYVVGVSGYPRYFNHGGSFKNENDPRNRNGDYKLLISGATPQVMQINIEIKPGSDELAPINPRSKGKIPVALLSSSGFDAMNVKPESLTFGATGDESSWSHCGSSGEDVNGDGRLDRVCHFENQKAGFEKGDLEGIVRGKMSWGSSFEGRAFLKVVPEKRGS